MQDIAFNLKRNLQGFARNVQGKDHFHCTFLALNKILHACCKHIIANLACTILARYLQVLQDGLHRLNLDLGIGTCLFDGMDGYTATWLQFVFPVYLWMIILTIILFYRRFHKASSQTGSRECSEGLATLFLLSYTKLQRTIVTIMSFTTLEYIPVVRFAISGCMMQMWSSLRGSIFISA